MSAGSHSASLSFLCAHKAKALASKKSQPLQTQTAALTTPLCSPHYVALGKQMKRSGEIQQRHRPHSCPCPLQSETQRGTVSAASPSAFLS